MTGKSGRIWRYQDMMPVDWLGRRNIRGFICGSLAAAAVEWQTDFWPLNSVAAETSNLRINCK
jgi:hypothetical protein